MKWQVWHLNREHFPLPFGETKRGRELYLQGGQYTHVADVDAPGLDKVFELTNHINSSWYENSGVTCLVEGRSTSTGDVIVREDGAKFFCAPFGWQQF